MGIQIGNGNKIKNSTIAEKIEGNSSSDEKKRFYDKHPWISSLTISFIIGFALLFHFWENIINWIEGWF